MNNLEKLRNKLDISKGFFTTLIVFSIVWFIGCFLLFIPAVRSLIIALEEFLVHRPLKHPIWQEILVRLGTAAIISYIIFLLVFFYEKLFNSEKSGKNLYFFVFAVAVFIVFLIMFRANWIFSDDHGFVSTTAINRFVPFNFYPQIGRFFPLGQFYYNILLFVFRLLGINTGLSAMAHFVFIALFYTISVLCLYLLFKKIKPHKGKEYPAFTVFFVCMFPLLSKAFSDIFMCLIYPETQVVMLFSVFIFMYYKALETDKSKYYTAALVAAVYNSYCKEPVFGALLVIALTNHLFRYKDETRKEKLFYTALIANGVLFLALYYFLAFKNATGFYNAGRVDSGRIRLLVSIFSASPILIIIFLLGFMRLYFIIFKKDRNHLYCDSLLFAGMAYVFAYFLLFINAGYYFTPAIILSVPSLVYWTKYLYQKKIICAFALFATIIMICTANLSIEVNNVKSILHERQVFMPYINNLLSEYESGKMFIWYESDNKVTDNMFYVAVRDWKKSAENAFLNYVNKTEGKEFFTVARDMEKIDFDKDILFFYPVDNDQNQPMPASLIKLLGDNKFDLYSDKYEILMYRRAE